MQFDEFSKMNKTRCESVNGFNHYLQDWTLSDWLLAAMGEFGEACNVAKKLNRYRDGIPGNKETEQELKDKFRREIGDTVVYLDLIATREGFSLLDAAIEVFESKSNEIGYNETHSRR